MDSPPLSDDLIKNKIQDIFPVLFSVEAESQGVTDEYILKAYHLDPTNMSKLYQIENVVLRNMEIKRIKSFTSDTSSLYSLSLNELTQIRSQDSPPKFTKEISNIPTDVSSKIMALSSHLGGTSFSSFYAKVESISRKNPLYWKERIELILGVQITVDGFDWNDLYTKIKILDTYNFDNVNYLVSTEINSVSFLNRRYYEILYVKAAAYGFVDLMRLLDTVYVIDYAMNGSLIISIAAMCHKSKVVAYLIDKPNVIENLNDDILYYFVDVDDFTTTKLILDHPKYNKKDSSAMNVAARRGNLKMFKLLWDSQKIKISDDIIFSCLHSSYRDDEHDKLIIVKLLLSNVNIRQYVLQNMEIPSYLRLCCQDGYYDIHEYFLRLDPNIVNGLDNNDMFSSAAMIDHGIIFFDRDIDSLNEYRNLLESYKDGTHYSIPGKKELILRYISRADLSSIEQSYEDTLEFKLKYIGDTIKSYVLGLSKNELEEKGEDWVNFRLSLLGG